MRFRTKRWIAGLLAAIMLIGAIPFSAFATEIGNGPQSGQVAYVWCTGQEENGEFYADINSAWKAALSDGNILLLCDWNTTEVLTVSEKKAVTVYMNGFSVDRGLSTAKDSGEVFLVREKGILTLYGSDSAENVSDTVTSKVTGGYNSNGGGGIHIQKNAGVYLYGVKVTGNTSSDSNGGGGVRIQGEGGYLVMDERSSIENNFAQKGDGGGVSLRGKNSRVSGGSIKENKASGSGGGVSTHAEGCSISGIQILNNTAGDGKKGGGIYMAQGCGSAVSNCLIEGNQVKDGNGGGIYVDGNKGSLSYSVVQKNSAVLGGGIYIDVGDTLSLSGEIVVKDNVSQRNDKDAYRNLYLETTSKKSAYISGYPSAGEVHISWDTSVRKGACIKLSDIKGTYVGRYVVSDISGYYVYWSWGTEDGKNDRLLRAANTNYSNEQPHDSTTVNVYDRYLVHDNGYKGTYDLQEGIFSYKATSGGDLEAVYYYSDGYFTDKPEVYNEHLATMSLALTMSGFNAAGTEFDEEMHNGGYANRFRNAKLLLSDLGFLNDNIHISESFTLKPTGTSIGVIMGAKELCYGPEESGDNYILIPIVVRGAGYESEWASNVTLGESGEAAGFSGAADLVMEEWRSFLASEMSIDLDEALEKGRVKFWVMGFSRAAATANLVAKRLTDQYGSDNQIYSYCFETPKGGVDEVVVYEEHTYNGQYLNIHNIINSGDLVPFVGPQEMGFKRYGVDHFVPGNDAGEIVKSVYETKIKQKVTTYADNVAYIVGEDAYNARRKEMIHQLAIIDDALIFDDYFSLATMNYVGSVAGNDMIGALENGTDSTAAEWIPVFVKHLVEWAANGTYSWSTVDGDGYKGDYRKFYSTNTKFSGKNYTTVEKALQDATLLIFGMDDSEAFMDAMMFRMNEFLADTSALLDFYIGVIAMWDEQAQYRQRWYMDDIWEILTDDMKYADGTPVPKITDFAGEGKEEEFEKSIYSLLAFLFLFVCRDYDAEPDLDGVDTTQIHLGTLVYNMSNVLQCHYPEVCMAWLRTYDSHYEESDTFRYEDVSVDFAVKESVQVPTITLEVEKMEDGSKVSLFARMDKNAGVDADSTENGIAIYYQIYENGQPTTEWLLYQDAIVFANKEDVEYSLKAYGVVFQTKGEIREFTDDEIKGNSFMVGTLLGEGSWGVIAVFGVIIAAGAVGTYIYMNKKKKLEKKA